MEIPTGGRDATISVNGVTLHYLEWGDASKPSLVLLHGMMSHAHTWDTFSGPASAHYHVIALDQRGHGDSGSPQEIDYTADAYVADLTTVIDTLNLAPVILIGHSMGGRNAVLYAAANPGKVTKLVIVDTPGEPPPFFQKMLEEMKKNPPPDNPQHEQFDSIEEVVQAAVQEYPLNPEPLIRHATQHNLKKLDNGRYTWKHDPRLRTAMARNPRPTLYDDLKKLHCPTLLMRGSESPIMPADVGDKMAACIPNAKYLTVQGAAHTINMDQADVFDREVMLFLGT